MGQGSGRVEPLHQHLEGHVLMLVGGQAAPPHLGQHLGDAGITGHLDPQHQGVDEKPHQLIERRVAPPGDREPDRHLGAGAELGQQHRQGGLHHHETGRIVLTSHPAHPLLQLGRPLHRHTGAAVIGNRRIGPIGGQLQVLGHPGQGLLPVGQLRGDRAVAVGQITQLRTLPQRVIDILHRQRRPARGLTGAPAGIGHPQITHQRGDRPAIGGDMVHHRHQHVLVLADAEKPCPQRDLSRQVKRATRRGADGLLQPAGRPAGGIDDIPAEVGPLDAAPPAAAGSPRPPGTACAGSHGGPPHRPAPPPTRRHQGARPAATPPPCCKPVKAPATGR